MTNIPSFIELIEKTIVDNWDRDALSDFKGITLQYNDIARKIEKLHILFKESNIQKGDKIALCGRNCSHWGVALLATMTYGAVAVPILHEFTHEQVYNIVNHSGSKLLFVGDVVAKELDCTKMPILKGVIYNPDFSVLMSRSCELTSSRENLNKLFGEKYPKFFRKENIHYSKETSPNDLAIINYTSGTTGFSKGVMIPYRALWSNYDFAKNTLSNVLKPGDDILSILPMAHMYGFMFEFMFQILVGNHVHFLSRLPSPAIIAQAFIEIKPKIIIAVPLVIEKIIRKKVFTKIQNNKMRLLLGLPIIKDQVNKKIKEELLKAFGGNMYEIIVGGAAFNNEVEDFMKKIEFPYTVGYGATECAPIICYAGHKDFVKGSCGKAVVNMEVKINSKDPNHVPGEILVRGLNVMLGYYKNEEATKQVLDEEGWYHTGDLGTIDKEGNVFIKGRLKNMLLGASGQNIYPEEIEDKLNFMPMVVESLVIQENDKLIGLVYPDYEEAKNLRLTKQELTTLMEENRKELNKEMPAYSRITAIRIMKEEFEKTPKKSIKRFLYQNN